jgi:hypothetical protein
VFPETDLAYILAPAFIVWLTVSLAVRVRYRNQADPVARAWNEFKLSISAVGVLLIVLWFSLPSTPSLSTFGYPADLDALRPERLLRLLQDYNRALVRTTEVVYWLVFIFAWWLLSSLYSIARALASRTGHNSAQQ